MACTQPCRTRFTPRPPAAALRNPSLSFTFIRLDCDCSLPCPPLQRHPREQGEERDHLGQPLVHPGSWYCRYYDMYGNAWHRQKPEPPGSVRGWPSLNHTSRLGSPDARGKIEAEPPPPHPTHTPHTPPHQAGRVGRGEPRSAVSAPPPPDGGRAFATRLLLQYPDVNHATIDGKPAREVRQGGSGCVPARARCVLPKVPWMLRGVRARESLGLCRARCCAARPTPAK